MLNAIGSAIDDSIEPGRLIERAEQIAAELDPQRPDSVKAVLMALVSRVEIKPDCISIHVSQSCLAKLLAAPSLDLTIGVRPPPDPSDQIVALLAPVRLRRIGREIKMLVDDSKEEAVLDPSLLKLVARAHELQTRLSRDTKLNVRDIARRRRLSATYLYALLRLPWLAPDITTAIINGRQPQELTATKLLRLTAHLPADWTEQRRLLGFS